MEQIAKAIERLIDGLYLNPITFITQIIATLILFLVIKHFFWKPMLEFLEKRQSVIVNELETAKSAKEDALELKVNYEEKLNDAKKQASEIVESARQQALETKSKIVKEAEQEAIYRIEKAEEQIKHERKKAEAEIKKHVVNLTFTAVEKLVEKNIDQDKNRQLIDQFIEEVGK